MLRHGIMRGAKTKEIVCRARVTAGARDVDDATATAALFNQFDAVLERVPGAIQIDILSKSSFVFYGLIFTHNTFVLIDRNISLFANIAPRARIDNQYVKSAKF